MKFFIPTVLLAASTVSAACDGAPVLEQCLDTTTETKNACTSTDYDCLCTAMKAVYGCFASSGCVDDDRSAPTNNEMQAYCAYVTTTAAAVSNTVSSSGSEETSASSTEESDSASTTAASDEGSDGDNTNSGGYLAMNAGGMMVAVAGVIAAVL